MSYTIKLKTKKQILLVQSHNEIYFCALNTIVIYFYHNLLFSPVLNTADHK